MSAVVLVLVLLLVVVLLRLLCWESVARVSTASTKAPNARASEMCEGQRHRFSGAKSTQREVAGVPAAEVVMALISAAESAADGAASNARGHSSSTLRGTPPEALLAVAPLAVVPLPLLLLLLLVLVLVLALALLLPLLAQPPAAW